MVSAGNLGTGISGSVKAEPPNWLMSRLTMRCSFTFICLVATLAALSSALWRWP